MKSVCYVFCITIWLFCLYQKSQSVVIVKNEWREYKQRYKLSFTPAEDAKRRHIFEENLQHILKTNAANLTYQLEMNHLGHLTSEEVIKGINTKALKRLLQSKSEFNVGTKAVFNTTNVPSQWDWRSHGVVTPVKNQGMCGSCWAFSATGAMESQFCLKYGKMKLFSEQQLVSCDLNYVDAGCQGGFPIGAFEYIRETGLTTEEKYPYTAKQDSCKISNSTQSRFVKINSYTVLGINEQELTNATFLIGPISVAIDASGKDFRFYRRGVYKNPNCKSAPSDLNHAVLVVGYGYNKLTNEDYYIVKNSWSEYWGDNGYIKMIRNYNNNCGIASFASFPQF